MPLAYSYLRFSSPQQAEGDSFRRQIESREKWLAAHPDVQLDTSLVLEDRGRSAFKRQDWDTYALAEFLRQVKSGRVVPGSYLLVENLDRLTRENIRRAAKFFFDLLDHEVNIVTLSPERVFRHDSQDMTDIIIAVVELSRGHSESAVKSDRCRAAWERKNREAKTRLVTKRLPGWIKSEGDRLVLDPSAAKIVQRAFDLARDGYSVVGIARLFNAERLPVMGRKMMTKRGERHKAKAEREQKPVHWSAPTIHGILTSRAAVGEYVPYQATKRADKPTSEAVSGYYPSVVDQDTFRAVQAALTVRAKVGRGRRGKHVNLFAGLLKDARDGGSISYCHRRDSCELIPVSVKHGSGTGWTSFPANTFERELLLKLAEVRVSDVREGGTGDAGLKVEAISALHADAEKKVKWYREKCDGAETKEDFELFAPKVGEWDRKRKSLAADLVKAQGEAASPLAESWGQFRSLTELLDKDTSDDLRIKVRAALRGAVDGIHCLFIGGGRLRVAVVQVWFRGSDCHRDYVMLYTAGRSNQNVKRPGECATFMLSPSALLERKPKETLAEWLARLKATPSGREDHADLRNPASARVLEKQLLKHLAAISAAM